MQSPFGIGNKDTGEPKSHNFGNDTKNNYSAHISN